MPDEEAGEDPKPDALREVEKGTLTGLLKGATAVLEADLGAGFEGPTYTTLTGGCIQGGDRIVGLAIKAGA